MQTELLLKLKCSFWRTYLIFLRNWGWFIAALITPGIVCLFLYNFKNIYHDSPTNTVCDSSSNSFLILSESRSRPLLEDAFCGFSSKICSDQHPEKLSEKNGGTDDTQRESKAVPLLWTSSEDEFVHHVMSEDGRRNFLRKIFTEFSALEKVLNHLKYPSLTQAFETEFDLNSIAKDAFFLNFLLKTHLRSDDRRTSAILNEKLTLNQALPNGTNFVTNLCFQSANISKSDAKEMTLYIVNFLCTSTYEDAKALITTFFNHVDWHRIIEKIHNMEEQKRRHRFTPAETRTLDALQESLSKLESIRSLLRLLYSLKVVLDEFAIPRKILRDTGWDSQEIQSVIAEVLEMKNEKVFRDFLFPFLESNKNFSNNTNKTSNNAGGNYPNSNVILTFVSLSNMLLKRFRWKSECQFDEAIVIPPHTTAVLGALNETNWLLKVWGDGSSGVLNKIGCPNNRDDNATADFREKTKREKLSSFRRGAAILLDILEKEAELKLQLGPCEGVKIVLETIGTIHDLTKTDVRDEVVQSIFSDQFGAKITYRLMKSFLLANNTNQFSTTLGLLKNWLTKAVVILDTVLDPFQQIFEEKNGSIYLHDILDHSLFHLGPQDVIYSIQHTVLNDIPYYLMGRRSVFEENCSTAKMRNVTSLTSLVCSMQLGVPRSLSSPAFHKVFKLEPNNKTRSGLSSIFKTLDGFYDSLEIIANKEDIPLKIVDDFAARWNSNYFGKFENELSRFQNRWPKEIVNTLLEQWSPQLFALITKCSRILEYLKILMEEVQPLIDYLNNYLKGIAQLVKEENIHLGEQFLFLLDLKRVCHRQAPDAATRTSTSIPDDVIAEICAIDFKKIISLLEDFDKNSEFRMTKLSDPERAASEVTYVWNLIQKILEALKSLQFSGSYRPENNSDPDVSLSTKESEKRQKFISIVSNIFERNTEVGNISAKTFQKLHFLNRIRDFISKNSRIEEFSQLNLLKEILMDSIPLALKEAVLLITRKPRIVHILHPTIMEEVSICHVNLSSFGKNIGQVWHYFCHLAYNELEEEMNRLVWHSDGSHVNNSKEGNFPINELTEFVMNFVPLSQNINEDETTQNNSAWKEVFPSLLSVSMDEIYENGSNIWAATISPLVAESRSPMPKSEKLRAILVSLDGHLRQIKLLLDMFAGGDIWDSLKDNYQDKPVVLQLFDYLEQSPVLINELLQIHINSKNKIYELIRLRNFAEFCRLHQKMLKLDENANLTVPTLGRFLDFICNDARRQLITDQLNPKTLPVIAECFLIVGESALIRLVSRLLIDFELIFGQTFMGEDTHNPYFLKKNLTMEPDAAVLGFLLDSVSWKMFMMHQGFLFEGHLQLPDWMRPFHWKEATDNLKQLFSRSLTDHLTLGFNVELNRIRSQRNRLSWHVKLLRLLRVTQLWMKDMEKKNTQMNSSATQENYLVEDLVSLMKWFTQTKAEAGKSAWTAGLFETGTVPVKPENMAFYEYMSGLPVENIVHSLCEDQIINLDPEMYDEIPHLSVNEIYLCGMGKIIYGTDDNSVDPLSHGEESYPQGQEDEVEESFLIKIIFENIASFLFSVDKNLETNGFRLDYKSVKEFSKRVFVIMENSFSQSMATREDSIIRMKILNNLMNYMVKSNETPIQKLSPDFEIIEIARLFSTKSKGGKWANLEEELLEQNLQFEEQFEKVFDIIVEKIGTLIHCLSFAEPCSELGQSFGFLEAMTESLLILSSNPRARGRLLRLSEEMRRNEASLKALYRMTQRPGEEVPHRDKAGQDKIISGLLRRSGNTLNLLQDPSESLNELTTVFLIINELLDYLDEEQTSLTNFTEETNFESNYQLLQNFKESVNTVVEMNQNKSLHRTELDNHLYNLMQGVELILNKSLSISQIMRTTILKDIIIEGKELTRQLTAIVKSNSSDDFEGLLNKEISLEEIQEFVEKKLTIVDLNLPTRSPEKTENTSHSDDAESAPANFSLPSTHFESKLIILKETNISLLFLKIENVSLHKMLKTANISELELQNTYLKINYEAAMTQKLGIILGFIRRVMSTQTKESFHKLIQENSDKENLESHFMDLFLLDMKKESCGFEARMKSEASVNRIFVNPHKEYPPATKERLDCTRLTRTFFFKENEKQKELLREGKIFVWPNSPFTRAFVHSMNETFQNIIEHKPFLDNLKQIVESACPDSAIKNQSEQASKILDDALWIFPALEYSFTVSLGLVDKHFEATDNLCSFLQSNRKVFVKVLEGLSKIFDCFDLDKIKLGTSETGFDWQSQENQLLAGVHFNEPLEHLSLLKSSNFNYRLKINISEAVDRLRSRRRYLISPENDTELTPAKSFPENILHLQTMIDTAILDITTANLQEIAVSLQNGVANLTGSSEDGNRSRAKRAPRRDIPFKRKFFEVYAKPTDFLCDGKNREFFDDVNNSVSFLLLVLISLFVCFVPIVTMIFASNEHSFKTEMRILQSQWLCANFSVLVLCSVLFLVLFAGFVTLLLKIAGLLPLSEASLIFILVVFFGMNLLAISYIITLTRNSKFTSVFCAEILLVLLALPFVRFMAMNVTPSYNSLVLTCFFPSSCFGLGIQNLLRFEVLGIGGSFRLLWINPTKENGLSLSVVLLMLLLDFSLLCVICLLKRAFRENDEGNVTCLLWTPNVLGTGGAESPNTPTDKRENFNIFHEPRSSIHRTLSGIHLRTVKAVGLQKLFLGKGRRQAVVGENLSFEAFQNQVFVFYGPPKSGKTTVLSMVAGLTEPSSGYVTVQGNIHEAWTKREKMLLSFCPSSIETNAFMTVREVLLYFSLLKSDLKVAEAKKRVETLLIDLELESWKNSLVSRLPKSLQKCVSIATAFAGESKIILLDEPLNDTERVNLRPVWKLISKIKKEKTFIIASKDTEEIECLADVIGILDKGKLIYTGSPAMLMDEFSPGYTVNIYNKQDIRMLFNVEQRIEELRDHLLEYIPSASFKSFDHEQGEIKFQLSYSDVQKCPDKLCVLFRELELRSEEMGVSHIQICHPSLKSILNIVMQNCGRGESRASLDLINQGTGFQRLNIPKFGSGETRPSRKHHLAVLKVLFYKRFLHNFRQMKVYLNVILLPALFFMLAMMSFWMIPASSSEKTWKTIKITNSDISNAFYAFPKEIYHWMDFEQHLVSILQKSKNNDKGRGHQNCDISEIRKNFLFKKDLHCSPTDDDTINFADCSCNRNKCVLKINVGWHKLIIPFSKRTFKVLPFLEWSYLDNHKDDAVIFYDRRKPKSLIILKTVLAAARIKSAFHQKNVSDSSLRFSIQSPGSVKDFHGHYLGVELVLLLPSSLLLAGLTIGVVTMSSQVFRDAKNGEKRFVISSGVPKFIYWSSCFAWDSVIVVSTVLLMMIVAALFQEPRLMMGHNLFALSFLGLLCGWSVQMMTYLQGLIGLKGSNFILSSAVHLYVGVITSFIVFFCEEFSHLQDIDGLKSVIHIIFLLFPQYVWMSGATKICSIHRLSSAPVSEEVNSQETISPFEWNGSAESGSIGSLYLALFMWVMFGCVSLVLWEIKTELLDHYQRRQKRIYAKDEEMRAESYDDSNLSLLISGLKYDVANNVDSSTVHFDAYACRGECLTIVGMKSSEKHSLLRYLTGEITAPTGTIYLVDEGGVQTPFEMSDNLIGFYGGTSALNPFLTAEEELHVSVQLRGVSKSDRNEVIQRALRAFDLIEFKDIYIGGLKEDVKKRIALSKAIIGDPKIVLLDEPNENASVTTRKIVTNLIKTSVATNRTVIVLSNYLEEAELISDRLAVFENGRIVHIGKIGIQDPSMHGRYLVKIQAEKGEDIAPITDVIKQEIQEFTIIEKYNTKIIADTSSEVTPYSIFGAISKARIVAPFWFEVSSLSLPQYYQRLGLHPTRNSSYSSTCESTHNEIPNSLFNEEDSCSTVTLPVFGKPGRDSFYDNLEEDFVPEKYASHKRTLSNRIRRGSGSSKLTPCSTPQPPRTPVEGNPSGSPVERKYVSSPRASIERSSLEKNSSPARQPTISVRRNVSAKLKLPSRDVSSPGNESKFRQMSPQLIIPEEDVPMKKLRLYDAQVKDADLMERFIENLPVLAPRASMEIDDDISETSEEEGSSSTSSEDRTEF